MLVVICAGIALAWRLGAGVVDRVSRIGQSLRAARGTMARAPARPSLRRMGRFSDEDIHANRDFFRAKLRAYLQKADLVHWVEGGGDQEGGFLLLDVRGRDAFAKAHVPGALCVPLQELPQLASQLPRDRELATFCWNHF